MRAHNIVTIIGTRPEAIKMAPVIRQITRYTERFDHSLVVTAQHREMLDQALSLFDLSPDIDLELMVHGQSLGAFASRSLAALTKLLERLRPDMVLVKGDTTTVSSAATAAFYLGIKVAHIEAGLRSFDRMNPFPEEINRRLTGVLADLHFAPTERARANLLAEGVDPESVFVTGNTVVDALASMSLDHDLDDPKLRAIELDGRRLLLVTAHRRENQGAPLLSICRAVRRLVERFPDVVVVYPVHLNPNVREIVQRALGNLDRVHLVEPVSYADLLGLIRRCYLVLTDSGGIQEEAPSFRKPVLVLREVTERPELVESGAGIVVGTDSDTIVTQTARLLEDIEAYRTMTAADNPFGDGHASERIVELIWQRLGGWNKAKSA